MDGKVIPKDTSSVWSQEGTEAHDWASDLLRGHTTVEQIPESFRPFVSEYADICRSLIQPGGMTYIEEKAPLFYHTEENGTIDFAFVSPQGIWIRDYKHGAGVPVDAEENTQLAIYGMSLITDLELIFGFEDSLPVSIGIHQPRYTGDESLKTWSLTVGELKAFCEPIAKTAHRIQHAVNWRNELEFRPSEGACKFCPAKAICVARLNSLPSEIMSTDLFEDLDRPLLPEINSVPVSKLVEMMPFEGAITKWFKDAREFLTAKAFSGEVVEGMKIVEGRQGNREWRDEENAVKLLKRAGVRGPGLYKPKEVISVASAEKIVKAAGKPKLLKEFESLTVRSAGKPVLVMESDKRPALPAASDRFEILTEEEEA